MNWPSREQLRNDLHTIIFESETRAGKIFDIVLLVFIGLSVLIVMLDSVQSIRVDYQDWLVRFEWFFTILFTIEYALRLIATTEPRKYAMSFYGVVDLFAILPSYLSLFLPGMQYLLAIRTLRVLRIFRIFKLFQYVTEGHALLLALRASRWKIFTFLFTAGLVVIVLGSLMYLIEGGQNGFTSIPKSIYWAVVTLSTVGYGDIAPQTPLGQLVAGFIMILGYGMIAVPTGIVTVELSSLQRQRQRPLTYSCDACGREGHDQDADFCKYCGAELQE